MKHCVLRLASDIRFHLHGNVSRQHRQQQPLLYNNNTAQSSIANGIKAKPIYGVLDISKYAVEGTHGVV